MEIVLNIFVCIMGICSVICIVAHFIFDTRVSFREMRGADFVYRQSKMIRYCGAIMFFGLSVFALGGSVAIREFDIPIILFGLIFLYAFFKILNTRQIIINKDYFIIKRLFVRDIKIEHKNMTYKLKREWAYRAGFVLRLHIKFDGITKAIGFPFTEVDLYDMVKILDNYKALRQKRL